MFFLLTGTNLNKKWSRVRPFSTRRIYSREATFFEHTHAYSNSRAGAHSRWLFAAAKKGASQLNWMTKSRAKTTAAGRKTWLRWHWISYNKWWQMETRPVGSGGLGWRGREGTCPPNNLQRWRHEFAVISWLEWSRQSAWLPVITIFITILVRTAYLMFWCKQLINFGVLWLVYRGAECRCYLKGL